MRKNTKQDILDKIEPSGECALWQGDTYDSGYGRVRWSGRMWRVHRLLWTLAFGAIPEGLMVLHKKDCHRRCCNLKHLYIGTHQDNMDDRCRNGKTSRGESHYKTVLSNRQKNAVIALARIMTQRQISRLFGVSESHVSQIVRGG